MTLKTKNTRLKKTLSHRFIQQVATLSSGNILSQAIVIGTAPIITRIFSPENFGLFALYFSLVGIISRVSTLGYERAVILPKSKKESAIACLLSTYILLFITILLLVVAFYFGEDISSALGNNELRIWLYAVPLMVLLTSLQNIVRFWLLREEHIALITYAKISDATVSTAVKILIGTLVGAWSGGLILGAIFGSLTAFILLLANGVSTNIHNEVGNIHSREISRVARKYKIFPQYATWSSLLNVLSEQAAIIFLSVFFGPAILGYYGLANRMLKQPIHTFTASVGNIYLKKSAHQVANKIKIVPGLKKVVGYLLLVSLIPFLLLGIYGDVIIAWAFGSDWKTAGRYAQILSPWFFALFVLAPTSAVFEICLKQKIRLKLNIATFIVRLSALSISYFMTHDVAAVLITFAITNVVVEISIAGVSFVLAINHDRDIQLQ